MASGWLECEPMAGTAAGAMAGMGPIAGIFGVLKEIIDEVGDITQAVIEQLNGIYLIDRIVRKTKNVHRKGLLVESKTTTDHIRVTLFEVLFLGLVFGVWELTRGDDGKLGLSWAKRAAYALGGPVLGPIVGGPDIDTGLQAPDFLPRDLLDPDWWARQSGPIGTVGGDVPGDYVYAAPEWLEQPGGIPVRPPEKGSAWGDPNYVPPTAGTEEGPTEDGEKHATSEMRYGTPAHGTGGQRRK